jgi:hypothetical protein
MSTTTPSHIETIREALESSKKALGILAHPGEHRQISEALSALEALSRQPAQTEDLEAEIEAIDKVLHFRAHKMTPGEAVKWLHELYTEQCVTLHEAAQRHKIGHGGEKLAKVASDALDSLTTQVRELREAAQVAADALDNFDGSVGYGSDSVFQTITWKKDDINPYAARIAAQEALSRLAELNIKPANTSDL